MPRVAGVDIPNDKKIDGWYMRDSNNDKYVIFKKYNGWVLEREKNYKVKEIKNKIILNLEKKYIKAINRKYLI